MARILVPLARTPDALTLIEAPIGNAKNALQRPSSFKKRLKAHYCLGIH